MGLADNVAIVALAVSLVALILSLLQMTQTFMGTAEGFRRCSPAIIGVWSRLRNRHWVWYEFRFETQFVTPRIVLADFAQLEQLRNEYDQVFVLNDNPLRTELELTTHPWRKQQSWSDFKRLKKLVEHLISHRQQGDPEHGHLEDDIPSTNLSTNLRKRLTFANHAASESLQSSGKVVNEKTGKKRKPGSDKSKQSQEQMLASWLRLLEELHNLYFSYWPEDCSMCLKEDIEYDRRDHGRTSRNVSPWKPAATKPTSANRSENATSTNRSETPTSTDESEEQTSTDRSDVAVILRRWSWDLMPAESVKPLAESTIGEIVVLARRLGMTWRTLNLTDGRLQADGNGFSLDSMLVNNLGIVFKFSANGRHDEFPRLIPSVAVDKLLCGILPGDRKLVRQDFELVKKDRTILDIEAPGSVLYRLGMVPSYADSYHAAGLVEPHNEVIMLLCPFLPLRESTIYHFVLDGFRPDRIRRSHFHFWEGRWALWTTLQRRIVDAPQHHHRDDLDSAWKKLTILEESFREDFYCQWDRSIYWGKKRNMEKKIWEDDKNGDAKLHLINTCRNIFDYTTEWFRADSRKLHEEYQKETHVTKYMLLVAAHMKMASEIIIDLDKDKAKKRVELSQHDLEKIHGFGPPPGAVFDYHRGPWIVNELIENVHHFADTKHIGNGVRSGQPGVERGIRAFFARRGLHFGKTLEEEDDHCEAMWWMLMLRGVTWDLSNWVAEAGAPVPPIFYGNQTPVWIT